MYSDSVFNREYVVCSNEEFDRFMASGGKNLLTALMRQATRPCIRRFASLRRTRLPPMTPAALT